MSVLTNLETKTAGWLQALPHLPKGGQKWLAENVWWLAIISVVASAIGVLTIISAIIAYQTFIGTTALYDSYYAVQPYGSGWVFTTVISLLFLIVTTAVTAAAINPLKQLSKKGWNLLFVVLIIQVVSIIINAIASLNPFAFIFSILFGAIGITIGAYFLFEIRSYFLTPAKVVSNKTTPVVK